MTLKNAETFNQAMLKDDSGTMRTFIFHYTVEGKPKKMEFSAKDEKQARVYFAMHKEMFEKNAVVTSVEEKSAPIDDRIARMTLKFNGVQFPALDLEKVELDIDSVAGRATLKIKTTSKGMIEMSCQINESTKVAEFQQAHKQCAAWIAAGDEYRRMQASN